MPLARVLRSKDGLPHVSGIASCTVAATSVPLYLISPGRSANIRKLHIVNRNAAATVVQIGTGITPAFVQALNGFYAVAAGQDLELTEEQITTDEFAANITVQATVAAVAPNDVLVKVEVEEYQGPIG